MSQPIILFNSTIEIADDQFNLLPSCTEQKPETFLNSNEYSRYVLCCLTTLQQNNLVFYKIPKLLKIYKGDPFYNVDHSKPSGKMSFNFSAEDASHEGFVHDFIFSKDVNVIAMDRVSNIQLLLAQALKEQKFDVVKAIENNFQIKRETSTKTTIIRSHNQLDDYTLLDYLCSLGYQGFAFKPLNETPAKIYLCLSHNYLSTGTRSAYDDQFVSDINNLK